MKHIKFEIVVFILAASLLASCVSTSERDAPIEDTSAYEEPVPTPVPLSFVTARGYLVGKAGNTPAEQMAAALAMSTNLAYSWWGSFEKVGDKVNVNVSFTIRKSHVVTEESYPTEAGGVLIRQTEMEVNEIAGLPPAPALLSQTLALADIADPAGILMKSRMEVLLGQALAKGFVRLAEARVADGYLTLVWDVRG